MEMYNMITVNPNGTKISSENENFSGKIIAKCPKCGCVYFSLNDFVSYIDSSREVKFVCNECQTDLEEQIVYDINNRK